MRPFRTAISVSFLLGLAACHFSVFENGKEENKPEHTLEGLPSELSDPSRYLSENPLNLQGALLTFNSCEETLSHLRKAALDELQRELAWRIESVKNRDNYRNDIVPLDAEPMIQSAESDSATTTVNKSAGANETADISGGPIDFTSTNNQVAGVEEADFVKNTGEHIYQISGEHLYISKSWPASEMALVSTTSFEGRPFQMLLADGERLVVLVNPFYEPEEAVASAPQVDFGGGGAEPMIMPGGYPGGKPVDGSRTRVVVLDISDKIQPKIQQIYELKGELSGARRTASVIRLVTREYGLHFPAGIKWTNLASPYPIEDTPIAVDVAIAERAFKLSSPRYYAAGSGKLSVEEQIKQLIIDYERNRKIIEETPLDFWFGAKDLARISLPVEQAETSVGEALCQKIHLPPMPVQAGITKVVTINLDDVTIDETILLAYTQEIYMSKKSLYLNTPYYWGVGMQGQTDATFIHKFNIEASNGSSYQGTGVVEGQILNQFAMDEYNDYLRVATTVTVRETQDEKRFIWRTLRTVNKVSIFKQKPEQVELELVGETEDLAAGERIYSVRFEKERGFVVTFRQVDPLFTLDLSKPEEPQVLGELKVPGFSSYIHMMDENHLLTVGRDADLNGRALGLKISIFDVSDMTKPKEVQTHVVAGGLSSEAQWDHKAFTYFPQKGMLALPVSGHGARFHSGLMIFRVAASEITPLGELQMNDLLGQEELARYAWYGKTMVKRSIFADDFLYAISGAGIRSANINALDVALASVLYEE